MSKFLKCDECSNMVEFVKDVGTSLICCNKHMDVLETTDINGIKSIQSDLIVVTATNQEVVVDVKDDSDYGVLWIQLNTTLGCQRKYKSKSTSMTIPFLLARGEKVITIQVYSRLHGLLQAVK